MSKILQQLYQDHRRLNCTIRLYERKLRSFVKGGDLRTKSLLDMQDILDHVQTYPELWHHPIEEKIFTILNKKMLSPSEQESIRHVSNQHDWLQNTTLELRGLLESVYCGQMVPILQIESLSVRLIEEYLEHIEIENRRIFPLIQDLLTPDDWRQVQAITLVVENKPRQWQDDQKHKEYHPYLAG